MTVYVVEAIGLDRVKIGYSAPSSLRTRLACLQTGCPAPLRVVGGFPEGGRQLEQGLHVELDGLRQHGEWFGPTDVVVDRLSDRPGWGMPVADPPRRMRFAHWLLCHLRRDSRLGDLARDVEESLRSARAPAPVLSDDLGVWERYLNNVHAADVAVATLQRAHFRWWVA